MIFLVFWFFVEKKIQLAPSACRCACHIIHIHECGQVLVGALYPSRGEISTNVIPWMGVSVHEEKTKNLVTMIWDVVSSPPRVFILQVLRLYAALWAIFEPLTDLFPLDCTFAQHHQLQLPSSGNERSLLQKLLNQIHVGHKHAPTAIAFAT